MMLWDVHVSVHANPRELTALLSDPETFVEEERYVGYVLKHLEIIPDVHHGIVDAPRAINHTLECTQEVYLAFG